MRGHMPPRNTNQKGGDEIAQKSGFGKNRKKQGKGGEKRVTCSKRVRRNPLKHQGHTPRSDNPKDGGGEAQR